MGALLDEQYICEFDWADLRSGELPSSAAHGPLLAGISPLLWWMAELCLQATSAQCCSSQSCDLSAQS